MEKKLLLKFTNITEETVEAVRCSEEQAEIIDAIFSPTSRQKIVNKGFTIREDQAKKIEKYSKLAQKKESEFIRDLLDYIFEKIDL